MSPDLIVATVLFSPAAVALPALAVAWHRSNRAADVERYVFAQLHQGSRPTPPPTGEPLPTPAPVETPAPAQQATAPAANVIDLTTRRRAA
ncbi:hypothetical protein ABZ769_08115 [Streptomyces olivoreticuli]